ncbi:dTDP-4-dehydrorhamnose reductase [candidate division WOR-1 bacterium RIFOXYB2_FULL_42_35]|uniref:dTDP-4-dehydrorhamnose reductase n=1 Tax=candidate division WOR-1 bacterium RIFOXYC2_FULL_41_25 TaxID=1802586 RepID=A0A1F4TIR3_UNCSA|nr:MAG: dTDP-4-dehydrorhamnose reductase [candidate division WOR-1 bacterium RIFOXYA2_FULL_41_14]OGC24026.1 MAG: dTDP-4-dehydrorhamnose reductase [candidate division WOR-1 bacterium RIFOXYB2_FULL_42_35]OGC32449.1 MAG: dTDP-4-dehydrorhamnose reductase [candidate division WOR-1 bacterium RIFOXYC2_FULL_41_25]
MKILIIGADGQLGSDLCKVIPQEEQIPLTIKDLDITNQEQTVAVLKKHQPDIVINTAAYNDVDQAEEKPELALAINADGVKSLAEACQQIGAVLVHISTDYVFDGANKEPYLETDNPNPQSAYATSKLLGEQWIKGLLDKYFIIRSTGLYGAAGCLGKGGTNFVENMIMLASSRPVLNVVADEVLSPTYTRDLAEKIVELIKTEKYGLYHLVNQGQCSWYEFACKIFEFLGRQVTINKITAAEYKAKAKRPKYSVLENAALKKIGLQDLRSWPEALKAYLEAKGYLGKA